MTASTPISLPFDNSYARLPEQFYARTKPAAVKSPALVRLNRPLAESLGLDPDQLESPEGIAVLSGNALAGGSEPVAMAYAGHQFGNFVPQLGDGRAILIGEVIDRTGQRRDLHLKGSGRTPFSRSGDGRAALGPVLREYVVSEAFAALEIPATRSLAALTTGDWVYRETPLPGAILVRVAASHIRVGTFQYFAARQDEEGVRILAGHVLARHYPDIEPGPGRYRDLLEAVIRRQANLVARWMLVGFIHGVMNTDNTSIAGETIDFGPCAFMDAYHPATVFSSIDHGGRYAYSNQPAIAQWNLVRFAETLLPLLGETREEAVAAAQDRIDQFPALFQSAITSGFARKLGLQSMVEGDAELIQGLLSLMALGKADFTRVFRSLTDCASQSHPEAERALKAEFADQSHIDGWLRDWRARLARDERDPAVAAAAMRRENPALIPRNHQIEKVIRAAIAGEDFAPFHRLVEALADPYELRPGDEDLALPPKPDEVVHQTFCGT